VAESLLEVGGLLITAGGPQDWNLHFSIWQVLWQSKSRSEETSFSLTLITSSVRMQKRGRLRVHWLYLP